MVDEKKYLDFENRISKVYKHRLKLATKLNIEAFRIYDRDLPEFPLIIDQYKDCLCVYEYKSKHQLTEEEYQEWLETAIDKIVIVMNMDREAVYLKKRERKKGEEQYEKITQQKKEIIVRENGLSFIVNLSDYLDTGLFFDHRITRQKVREEVRNKTVLNLFAYTGSFSIYAAAGGAKSITTVDMSHPYTTWARRNLTYNKLYDDKKHFFIQANVLDYLKANRQEKFDFIICDPPSFSNSKRMYQAFDIQRDYADLIKLCLDKLNPNGILLFSTNKRQFEFDAALIKCSKLKDISKSVVPFDFEGKFGLTVLWIEK